MARNDWRDMRDFLDFLEKEGDLVRVKKEVSVVHEIAAYIRKTSDVQGPAFLFENVKDYPGWRVQAGMYACHRRLAAAIGSDVRGAQAKYRAGIDKPIDPVLVTEAPCQEVVWIGDRADLHRLPIVTHSEKDNAPYITSGVQVAKDPDTGIPGLGIHRQMVMSPGSLGIWAPAERRIGRARVKREERGEELELAVVIGADPLTELAACARVPHSVSKYAIAGGLLGRPLELVRCKTIDVEVPANAEVVIEATFAPNERQMETPFGEFPGCYGGRNEVPICRIKAITMRADPIYQTVLTGFPVTEDHLMNWLPMSAVIYNDATRMGSEVKAVNIRANYVYHVLVSVKKRLEHEPWNIIASVLSGNAQAKYCMVVDEDVDIFDERDIDWAFCTRVRPDRDIHIYPTMVGAPLDPSAPIVRQTSKVGIDATIPFGDDRTRYERVLVPGVENVHW